MTDFGSSASPKHGHVMHAEVLGDRPSAFACRKPLAGFHLLVLGEHRLATELDTLGKSSACIAAGDDALALVLCKRAPKGDEPAAELLASPMMRRLRRKCAPPVTAGSSSLPILVSERKSLGVAEWTTSPILYTHPDFEANADVPKDSDVRRARV
jgi:hypothetical protein